MKIAILSDTHVPSAAAELPGNAYKILEKADAIIHAGDFQVASVIDTLQSIAPFYGVCGNMDDHEIRQRLPVRRIIQLGGFAVGVMHGWGSPAGLEDRIRAFSRTKGLTCLFTAIPTRQRMNGKTGCFSSIPEVRPTAVLLNSSHWAFLLLKKKLPERYIIFKGTSNTFPHFLR